MASKMGVRISPDKQEIVLGVQKNGRFFMAEPEKALLDLIYIRLVRNREFDTEGMKSLLEDMYMENLDKALFRTYAKRFGERVLKIVEILEI